MSALAGWVTGDVSPELERSCALILAGQAIHAGGMTWAAAVSGAALAAADDSIFPGEKPLLVSNERLIAVADARLDNRRELCAELGFSPAERGHLSDCGIILHGWSRWREALLDQLVGDFAFAVYDKDDRRLFVARDPSGQRPCFYSRDGGRLAVASMPGGLLAHPRLRRGWDLQGFKSALADELAQESTYFNGIRRLLPGHCLSFANGELSVRRWWNPNLEPLSIDRGEYVETYRDLLDQAVRCRMDQSGSTIACYLSAGWDSNAVAATAARAGSAKIVAYTSAPPEQFRGPVPRGFLADESSLAAIAAERYGIEHHVVRSAPLTLEFLEAQALSYQEPARNIINGAWGAAIHQLACERDARVLLTGALGNLSLNSGGLPVLAQYLRERGPAEWAVQALLAKRRNEVSWRGVLYNSFAPWLPRAIWHGLRRAALGARTYSAPFLHARLRSTADTPPSWAQPSGSFARDRLQMISLLDHGMITKGAVGEAGIDERDPFSDRRLIEFSLRLPPEQLLNRGEFRPLARRALADRVPQAILDNPLRGLQSADWPFRFSRNEAQRIFDAIAAEPDVAAILDLSPVRAAIQSWPEDDRQILEGWELYSRLLPAALATGVFIKAYQPLVSSGAT